MNTMKKILQDIWLPLLLLCLDVFVFGQGMVGFITILVIVFYFLPKVLLSLRKDKEKAKKYLKRLLTYAVMVAAIFGALHLNSKLAEHRASLVITALDKYQAKHQNYPDGLDQLVPEFLPRIPKAKINLLYGNFSYISSDGSHTLLYIAYPPFYRRCYNLEEKKWSSLD